MMYPSAYIQFLVHFHSDRDYFECHEILEEYWKETANQDKHSIWVGFILLAVSNYHYRRGNLSGAARTLSKSLAIFQGQEQTAHQLGINLTSLIPFLEERLIHIKSGFPYSSFNLPISDPGLLRECQQLTFAKGLKWGVDSNLDNKELIHRHALRDRSDVIQERSVAMARKNDKKGRE
ncbi:DUF309 domain-containing protein [Neobacillus sp. LXY-4]|uniref:DUF309 domain-containing protein n=1 Tax=Neobacillus sp. LXY-4 TaxID=3379826 RepID=UPI003EE31100